ncbi:MAG TPA: sodium:solute symporter family protein [Terriglobales bacterium]|nr:sodium:solute symporter family protein [Terriglobales bacterium]
MNFTFLDWSAIVAYLVITLAMGLYFRRRSGRSVDDYFVSGRNVSWWLAGTSMVATTFAADTPLVVTGLVYSQGIAGNWLWWCLLPSGMMTVFLFARLWRRSGLLTDVQFAEMRYTGRPAAFLRGFRAIYLGLLMNCLILGWVTKAMVTIVGTTLGVSPHAALAICIFFLIPFTGLYVSLGGLWGVLWTDLFQFILKMAIVIAVAYYAVGAVGGLGPLVSTLHGLRTTASAGGAASAGNALSFFPDFSRPLTAQALWLLPGLSFVVYLAVQWWAFWYPGAEPGGGGYIAQRIFSAKDERNGLLSVLWFNIAHYAIRPWPWIIAALAAIVLYPHLEHPETGYMLIVNNQMPHALKGVVIAGFMAAFMSTIATQLNWGASYLVADFYRRFIKPNGSENHYVNISRLVTVLLVICSGYVAAQLTSIKSGWEVVLEIGAGTGGVYLLRWYWWRINAWSEISAMATALAVTIALRWAAPFGGQGPVLFAKTAITTTAATTVVWIVVTFLTKPESEEVLLRFYRKARPDVRGWKPVALKTSEVAATRDLGRNLGSWILGCVMVYGALFGIGWLTLGPRWLGGVMMAVAAVAAALLYNNITHGGWEMEPEPAAAAGEAHAALPRH